MLDECDRGHIYGAQQEKKKDNEQREGEWRGKERWYPLQRRDTIILSLGEEKHIKRRTFLCLYVFTDWLHGIGCR